VDVERHRDLCLTLDNDAIVASSPQLRATKPTRFAIGVGCRNREISTLLKCRSVGKGKYIAPMLHFALQRLYQSRVWQVSC
jgi:hypothetical protein